MEIRPLRISGTYEIQLCPRTDDRGYFLRTYDESVCREHGLVTTWVQENQALSAKRGVVRGLHYQKPPHAETKLVRAVAGAALDVFVDLRVGSPTYGQWDSVELTADNLKCVYVPKGFAHGYCTLIEGTVMVYKVDAYYAPKAEGGVCWNDETLAISWPVQNPMVSPRDAQLPKFAGFASPFTRT
jgi:dTDP-4-dehydrorhamnose 3,5-epimerase